MNLLELKEFADRAIGHAIDCSQDPATIPVSIQINKTESEFLWSDDIELTYDNDGQASGCVLHGWKKGA